MYDKDKTLKVIYNIDIEENYMKDSIQEWYYNLIQKTYNQLELSDVCRMLVQKVFIGMGVNKAIEYLQEDVMAGNYYPGELLQRLYEIPIKYYEYKIQEVNEVITISEKYARSYDWLSEENYNDYYNIIQDFKNKLHKYKINK